MRLALPSLSFRNKKVVFAGPSYHGVPRVIEPVSPADEQCIIETFVEEMNNQFMTELATEVKCARDLDIEDPAAADAVRGKRFIPVGSSHMARLAFALEDQDGTVIELSVPGWRATAESVDSMVAQLKSVLQEDYCGETVILYQLFDNSCYMSCDEEGNRALPVKGRDHKYHVPGRLVLAGR
jgi:hypothetical protein